MLAFGVIVGSRTAVGLATPPALGAALVAMQQSTGHAWGRTLLVGLLWYLASEAAWASVSARDAVDRHPGVGRQRLGEVATVVAVSAGVAAVGASLAAVAPARTAVVKGLAVAAVLVALALAARHLARLASQRPSG